MASLSQAKMLGGVGSILVLLSFVPTVGVVLGIVGFILALIAVHTISQVVADRSIFNNMLISVVLNIAGLAILGVTVFSSVMSIIGITGRNPSNVNATNIVSAPGFMSAIVSIIVGLVLLWIFFIVGAIFLRKSYNSIAARLNIGMFRTTALIYLIGAFLTIILIGFALLFVAQILMVIAFFQIPETAAAPQPPTMPPPAPTSSSAFCRNCGASIPPGTAFCPSCGAKQ